MVGYASSGTHSRSCRGFSFGMGTRGKNGGGGSGILHELPREERRSLPLPVVMVGVDVDAPVMVVVTVVVVVVGGVCVLRPRELHVSCPSSSSSSTRSAQRRSLRSCLSSSVAVEEAITEGSGVLERGLSRLLVRSGLLVMVVVVVVVGVWWW